MNLGMSHSTPDADCVTQATVLAVRCHVQAPDTAALTTPPSTRAPRASAAPVTYAGLRVGGEPAMLYDDQGARWAALRADQAVIDRAAARLRHERIPGTNCGPAWPCVSLIW